MESQKTVLTVQIGLQELVNSYSSKEFVQKCIVDAIKSNTKAITELVEQSMLATIFQSGAYGDLFKAVQDRVRSLSQDETLTSSSQFNSAVHAETKKAVEESSPVIKAAVQRKLSSEQFNQGVGKQIAAVVEERVKRALGEVCDDCQRDYY